MERKDKNIDLAVYWAQAQPSIATFIHSMVPNFQDSDDILQEVAVLTVQKFEEFDRSRSFSAWAIGIARNLILRYYSQKGGKWAIWGNELIEKTAQVYEKEYQSIHDQKESMEKALKKCLMLLKGKWKTIVDMYYLDELSSSRIAQQLSITQDNVFVSLHRIRLSLKECVERKLREVNS